MVSVEVIYQQPRFANYAKKLAKATGLHDDLVQHCTLMILGSDPAVNSDDELFSYFVVTARNEFCNKYSRFNKIYRGQSEVPHADFYSLTDQEDDGIGIQEISNNDRFKEFIESEIQKPSASKQEFVYKEVFKLCLKHGGIRPVSRLYGIPFNTLRTAFNHYKQIITNNYEQLHH